MENSDFDDYMNRIKIKLDENPELSDRVAECKDELSEIFETEVDITLNFNEDVESYKEIFNGYNESELENVDGEPIMVLGELVKMLESEDQNLKLSFDPLHLKEGINNINNILITTYEDNVIIVPIRKKEE